MEKRLLSILLALCMVLSLMTGTALAVASPFEEDKSMEYSAYVNEFGTVYDVVTGEKTVLDCDVPADGGITVLFFEALHDTLALEVFEDMKNESWAQSDRLHIVFVASDKESREDTQAAIGKYIENGIIDEAYYNPDSNAAAYWYDKLSWYGSDGMGQFQTLEQLQAAADNSGSYKPILPRHVLLTEVDGVKYFFSPSAGEHLLKALKNELRSWTNFPVDGAGTVHMLTLDPNGGTVSRSAVATRASGELMTVLPKPRRDGYEFDDWYTAPTEGTRVSLDTVFTRDTTVYAHWLSKEGDGKDKEPDAPTVTLTFDANGGSVSQARKDVVYKERYGELPTPVNGTKTFYGWYTQPEGGTLVSSDTVVDSPEDHTVYAHWSVDSSALTPAKAGDTFLPAWNPFDKIFLADSTFSVTAGSNANRENGSYLYANEKGGLTRVQVHSKSVDGSIAKDYLVVTEMDSDFNITAQGTLPMELTQFMGFYPGKTYNFLLFAQFNPQGESREVIRVVKYDKSWNRLGSGCENAGTTIGVGNGTGADFLECAEYNDYLYVHTGRVMSAGHQACETLVFQQSDMKKTDSTASALFNVDYVSHGYDQQIMVDREGRLVSLDLGDAGKHRAVALFQYKGEAHGTLSSVNAYHLQEIAGTYEEYGMSTGCTVAGLVDAGSYYLVVYQYDPTLSSMRGDNGDLFYQFVDKDTLTGKSVKLADAKVDGVKVAAVDDSSGYIIWTDAQDESKIYYAAYSNGTVGTVRQAEGYRAGSTPIPYQGKLVWFVDVIECPPGRGTYWTPTSGQYYKRFYTLDPGAGTVTHKDFMIIDTESASSKGFIDVPAGAWYADAVAWAVEKGITSGTTPTTFSPDDPCTRAQIVTFLWRAAGSPAMEGTNPFRDVARGDYYYDAVLWAVENNITAGTTGTTFSPNDPCTRAQAVSFLYRAKNSPAVSGTNRFTDLVPGAYYRDAVQWAVNSNVTAGTSDTTFSPEQTCTRAQIVSFLYRDRAG